MRTQVDVVPATLPAALFERRREQKRLAIARLLEWGFAASDIALILGCSARWVESIRDHGPYSEQSTDHGPDAA